jgi:hypothetical protein
MDLKVLRKGPPGLKNGVFTVPENGFFRLAGEVQTDEHTPHTGLGFRDIDPVDMDYLLRSAEIIGPNGSAEMITPAESDMEAQFFIEQDFSGRPDTEVPENTQTHFRNIAVSGFRFQSFRFRSGMGPF